MSLLEIFQTLSLATITTIAGVGYREGILAKEADAGWPMGVVRRPDGDLIVVDYNGHRLWRIDQQGVLHAFAGDGVPGHGGDGGPARQARFFHPHDLTQDKEGNLYLSDLGNQTYRRIDYQTGLVSRVAGSGKRGRGGDGGPALEAELDTTCGIAVDEEGNLYLSSEWGNNIRRVEAKIGFIEHFAGLKARHYLSEQATGPHLSLMGYHGDGGPAAEAAFHHPEHLAFDSKGDLYVCDNSNDRIRKINQKTGLITTVFGNGQRASNGDGGPAVEASTLMPDAICFDAHDNLYVGEKYGYRIRKIEASSGIVRTLVGNGVPGFGEEGLPGQETHCNSVEAGIWADPDGTVFWSDCSGRLRRYDGQSGLVTTVLGGTHVHDGEIASQGFLTGPGGLAVGPRGHIYVADVWGQRIRAIDPVSGLIHTVAGSGARAYGGDNGPAGEAHLGNPHDVSVDSQGRLVIADTRNGRLRRVEEDGIIRVIAGTTFPWDSGHNALDRGDGGPALSACLASVLAVTHAPNDDIYLGGGNGRIRKIEAKTGIMTTIAGTGLPGYSGDGGPAGQARLGTVTALRFDQGGNLYFTDQTYHLIRKVDAQGLITTLAGCGEAGFSPDGTLAREAKLDSPYGLAISVEGVIYFSDSRNNRVRRITPDGLLETVAGSDTPGDAGDGGPATAAGLNEPHGLCLYGTDILLISDHWNNRIKAVKLK